MANVYRADQVGSLVTATPIPDGGMSDAVKAVLSMQKQCGIDVVTDGELLRTSTCSIFAGNVEGVELDEGGKPHVAGPLQRKARLTASEVDLLKRAATGPFKIALPAPTVAALELFREGLTSAHYPTRRDLAQALASILRQEIADLIADGVAYVQLNGPVYELASDRAAAARLGSVDEMLSLDTETLRDLQRPEKLTLALHLPRARDASGALLQNARPGDRTAMLESAFARTSVDRFLIEFPLAPTAADFAPLRAVPQGKMAVLGLVDPLAPRADDVDPLLDRLDTAVTFVGAERLALSPQRGFALHGATRESQLYEAQRRSLTLTAEAARRFWGFEM